jgi:hypothetical protein
MNVGHNFCLANKTLWKDEFYFRKSPHRLRLIDIPEQNPLLHVYAAVTVCPAVCRLELE